MEHPNIPQSYVLRLRLLLASSLTWVAQWLRSSFIAPYFPWLFPLVVQFVVAHGGLRVEIRRNGQLVPQWRMRMLRSQFPLPLIYWIENIPQYRDIQPYPWVRQLYDDLQLWTTEKCHVDGATFASLLRIAQPEDFALIWTIDPHSERLVGRYIGIEHDLGMGWFQRGNHIWSLKEEPDSELAVLLRGLNVSFDAADRLIASLIPRMSAYLPVRADFTIIKDFSLMIVAPYISFGTMRLALQCNYPDLLSSLRTLHSYDHLLIAHHALICFLRAAITPRIAQLLHSHATTTLTNAEIPCFLRDELPSLQARGVVSNKTIADIKTRNPLVAIPTLTPTRTLNLQNEQGIGTYQARATYQYNQHMVDVTALIQAGKQGERFIRQHDVWFEWPQDPSLQSISAFQKDGEPITLTSAEVMGLDMTRLSAWQLSPPSLAITPAGISSAERGRELFKHLRQQGVPGGIVGQPKGVYSILADVGESLLSSNLQAQILWVVPANKKGSVTRTLRDKPLMNSCASVVTPAIIATVPQILTKRWSLVIFQELDQLLAAEQYNLLPRLQWRWAITTLTPNAESRSSLMRVLHLPGAAYERFCDHYLYDIEKESNRQVRTAAQVHPLMTPTVTAYPAPRQSNTPTPNIVSSAKPTLGMPNAQSTVSPAKPVSVVMSDASYRAQIGFARVLASDAMPLTPSAPRRDPRITLDANLIAMLLRESAELQERLTIEDDDMANTAVRLAIIASLVLHTPIITPDAESTIRQSMPDVGDDWQSIAEQWQPTHWEILTAIHLAEPNGLALIAQRMNRPLSLLIDEINAVVDQQIGDTIIDPDTHSMTEYYQETAGYLVQWHLQRK